MKMTKEEQKKAQSLTESGCLFLMVSIIFGGFGGGFLTGAFTLLHFVGTFDASLWGGLGIGISISTIVMALICWSKAICLYPAK